MLRLWNRFISFHNDRVTKKVFQWDKSLCNNNWSYEIKDIFTELGQINVFNQLIPIDLKYCKSVLHSLECDRWRAACLEKPKLRTYVLMKTSYGKESYVTRDLNRTARAYLARIRTGTLLLMVEVGRFRGVELEERICPVCGTEVEDEIHFLFSCPHYNNLRMVFFDNVCDKGYFEFNHMSFNEKLNIIMKENVVNFIGKFIYEDFSMCQNFVLLSN